MDLILIIIGSCIIGYNTSGWIGLGVALVAISVKD